MHKFKIKISWINPNPREITAQLPNILNLFEYEFTTEKSGESTNTQRAKNNQEQKQRTQNTEFFYAVPNYVAEYIKAHTGFYHVLRRLLLHIAIIYNIYIINYCITLSV